MKQAAQQVALRSVRAFVQHVMGRDLSPWKSVQLLGVSSLLVKKRCAQGDFTSQVIKQVAHVQWFVDADELPSLSWRA